MSEELKEKEAIVEALEAQAKALPSIYGDPRHYDLLAQMTAPQDHAFYEALAREHGGPVLDLGCGTGRVGLALAKAIDGVEVYGVELSAAMLEAAKLKAEHENVGLTLAFGDLRSFDLERTFPLILLSYNTINHLLDDESLFGALDTIAKHMDENSRLAIDTFQPSLAFLGGGAPEEPKQILRYVDPYLDKETRLFEENHYDAATQKNKIVWRYEVDGMADARVDELTMRLYFPRELDAVLALKGFTVEKKLGSYDGEPFGSTSSKQLYVCRRSA